MNRVRRFLEKLYDRKIKRQFDRHILVIGDERIGKSTFMLRSIRQWQGIRDQEPDTDQILSRIVWDQDDFKNALANFPARSMMSVQDAARVLHKREAMNPDQIEVEKDLLDSGIQEQVVLYGFQDWDIVPTMLQVRRAKNVFHIPRRGVIHGYNRDDMDYRIDEGEWPEPSLTDRFESLDGTELYEKFNERDTERKKERISVDSEDGEEELTVEEVVEDILEGDLEYFVSEDGRKSGRQYVDDEIIQFEYNHLSHRESRQVKKVLERREEVQSVVGGGEAVEAD